MRRYKGNIRGSSPHLINPNPALTSRNHQGSKDVYRWLRRKNLDEFELENVGLVFRAKQRPQAELPTMRFSTVLE